MILPTKHLSADRALMTIGALILQKLSQPKTVTALWDDIRMAQRQDRARHAIAYEWFVLALDLLYMLGAIKFDAGVIVRGSND